MVTKASASIEVEILEVKRSTVYARVLGNSPIILNRLSEKAQRQLLLPAGRKNSAERASSMKHSPLDEYRASPYMLDDGPTAIGVLSTAFKGAMMSAALDMPGFAKAQVGRLVHVEGDYVPVFGVPRLFMSIVRSADINHTPDIRTRAIIPRWACEVAVTFAVPLIREQQVVNLLAASGLLAGVGDWRPGKGKGSYGAFSLVDAKDEAWSRIVADGGRDAQLAALATPVCYDHESEELLSWFHDEVKRRGFEGTPNGHQDEDAEAEVETMEVIA